MALLHVSVKWYDIISKQEFWNHEWVKVKAITISTQLDSYRNLTSRHWYQSKWDGNIKVMSRMISNQEFNVNVAKTEISNEDLNGSIQLELKLISTLESATYDANEWISRIFEQIIAWWWFFMDYDSFIKNEEISSRTPFESHQTQCILWNLKVMRILLKISERVIIIKRQIIIQPLSGCKWMISNSTLIKKFWKWD